MRYSYSKIVFQEVPSEISLAFHITGCQLKCEGCHSKSSWNFQSGYDLNIKNFREFIQKYKSDVTCILFLGGEWHQAELVKFLEISQLNQLKTALYTGLELHEVPHDILSKLDYLKYGRFVKKLGGLDQPQTNQVFIHVKTMEKLNQHFIKRDFYDQTDRNSN